MQPLVLPILGSSEMAVFLFVFKSPLALFPLSVDAQFAAGEGATDSAPILTGDHLVQYFTVNDATVTFGSNIAVSVPSVMSVLACVLVAVLWWG